MKETKRDNIIPILLKEFYDEQARLRGKLLMFRFRKWQTIDENDIKEIIPKFDKKVEKRLIQASVVFSVLFSNDEKMSGRFHRFVEGYQEKMIEDRSLTFDGLIVNTIYTLIQEGVVTISSGTICDKLDDIGIDAKSTNVGKHLKTLGFETTQKRVEDKVKRVIAWDENLLISLFQRYVIDPDCSNVASVALLADKEKTVQERLDGGG